MDVVLPVQTSLLQAILRELPLSEGSVEVGGTISYASQEPWMFAGSVRQNILFGQPYVRERYNHVVRVCTLKHDFQLLPYADKTIVGERGVSLSGGQRARANLARYVDYSAMRSWDTAAV
jgi:ATP-binding cassette subfamily C (CFTR/MRP) protein 4